jgi:hypothetical protein
VETDNGHGPILDLTAWYGLILIEDTCQTHNVGYLSEEAAGARADQWATPRRAASPLVRIWRCAVSVAPPRTKDWRGAVGCYAATASRVNISIYEGASCS